MKKGFTLIELIAVIIIISIIAIIATPIILNVIEESKQSAGESEANLILNGISEYCERENMGLTKTDYCKNSILLIENIDKIINLGKVNKETIELSIKDRKIETLILEINSNKYRLNKGKMEFFKE